MLKSKPFVLKMIDRNYEGNNMDASRNLKRRFVTALLALLIALLAALAATFAWYIYNTTTHTTNVRMAAGASASLKISNDYDGNYGSAAILDEFVGTLNPVSTDQILNGFQKVYGFTNGSENQSNLVASLFGAGEASDYYMTSLYLRANGDNMQVYLADIGYEDSDLNNPISTAVRVGIVTYTPGKNGTPNGEYIFEINRDKNPQAEYNTASGEAGYVLDSTKTDGSTVKLTPYNSDNYCNYDSTLGTASRKTKSVPLCEISGNGSGEYAEAVQIDVYIWLEGCDEDCTNNLCSVTLKNLALSFVGIEK